MNQWNSQDTSAGEPNVQYTVPFLYQMLWQDSHKARGELAHTQILGNSEYDKKIIGTVSTADTARQMQTAYREAAMTYIPDYMTRTWLNGSSMDEKYAVPDYKLNL